jgi:tetratricopeptide (TPR) repeat protein
VTARWGLRSARREALALREAGDAESAAGLLHELYREHNDTKSFEALVEIWQKQRRWQDLEAMYRERVESGDRRWIERLGHAICAQDGREQEGLGWLLVAVEEGHDVSLALMNLGATSKRLGRTDEAIAYFERALLLGDDRARMELVWLLEDGPRDGEVDALLRRAIDEGHKRAPAYLARRLWSRGSFAEIEALYRLSLDRHHGPGPAAELGCVLRMRSPDRRDEAGALVDRALELGITASLLRSIARFGPVTPDAGIWLLGRAYRRARTLGTDHKCGSREFFDAVLAALVEMLTKEQRYAEGEELLADVQIAAVGVTVVKAAVGLMEAQRRWPEVERIYRERVDSGDRAFLERLGHSIAEQGRYEDAEQTLNAAVSEDQNAARALLNLGELAKRDERKQDAIEYFERALRLGEIRAASALAGLLEDGPRDGEAESLYRRAMAAGNASAPAYLARRAWKLGEKDELEELYGLALERGHGPAVAVELACFLHSEHPGRLDEAESLVARAMEMGIDANLLKAVSRFSPVDTKAAIWMMSRAFEFATEPDESPRSRTSEERCALLDGLMSHMVTASRRTEAEALCRHRIETGEVEQLRTLIRLLNKTDPHGDALHKALSAAAAHDVDAIDSLHDLASLENRRGRPQAAIEHLERAIALGDESVATVWLARLLRGGPRADETEDLLLRSSATGFPPAFLDRAMRLVGAAEPANPADAEALVGQAVEAGLTRGQLENSLTTHSASDSERAWMLRTVLQALQGNSEATIAGERSDLQIALAQVLEADPDTVDEARDLLTAALEAEHKWAPLMLGLLEERYERWQEAERWFHLGADGRPDAFSLRGLARVALAAGDPGKAEASYRQAVEMGDGNALLDLARMLESQGDRAAVAAVLCESVDRDVREAHGALGRLLVELGAPLEDASRHFRHGVAQGDGRAANNLGYLLAQNGDVEQAISVYRRGVEADHRYCMSNLAELLAERGERDEAEQLYRRSIALGNEDARAKLEALVG